MKKISLMGLLLFLLAPTSYAGLIDTELSLKTIFQRTPTSSIENIGFLTTATVIEPEVEFPSINDLQIDGASLVLVDVSINIGDDFIEIDFENSAPSSKFAAGFENTYVLKFDSVASVNIVGAEIDNSVTTLALDPSDVTFTGNELFINVESLAFNPSMIVRINLKVEKNATVTQCVPENSTIGVVSSNLHIYMPSLNYQSINGNQNLWADFEYYERDNNGNLLWKLKEYGFNPCLPISSKVGTVSSNLNIYMPSLNYQSLDGNQNLWADFEHYGQDSNGTLLWKLKGYGENQ